MCNPMPKSATPIMTRRAFSPVTIKSNYHDPAFWRVGNEVYLPLLLSFPSLRRLIKLLLIILMLCHPTTEFIMKKKSICVDSTLRSSATWSLAISITSAELEPISCELDGLPQSCSRHLTTPEITSGRGFVVALLSK